ncbi:MAG: cyclic nucleotide-binding domain-containing protein [bacterium]|nr:cyclic nucleotide-binding domain-containing protein [bacterium]
MRSYYSNLQVAVLDFLFYIHKGSMSVFHGTVKTDVLKEGDFIGQLTFVTREFGLTSLSEIVALDDVRIIQWQHKKLHEVIDKYISIRVALLSVLAVNMSGKLTECYVNCKEWQMLQESYISSYSD